jgi:SAM-dependent methyltransferase
MMGAAEDISLRGAQMVEELRGRAGLLERLFLYRGRELIDLDTTPDPVKQRIMLDVERLNRWLRMYPLWLRTIGRLILEARRTTRGKPVRVLDVGAGHGRLLFEIEDWARKRRVAVELHGLEYDEASVAKAQRVAGEEGRRAHIFVGDGRALPFETGAMDVVCSTFMMHHLPAGDVARVLAEIDRVAAVNWFVFDVRRTMAVFPGLWALLRVGAFEAPSRHDALASLRRSYTVAELEALLRAASVKDAVVRAVPPSFLTATRL